MIQVNELRIGNYINYEQTTHVIAELHSDKVLHFWEQCTSDRYFSEYQSIKGIKLSKQWLLKLGFELDEEGTAFFHQRTGFPLTKQFTMYAGSYIEWVKIDYVHQLQNLHFALKGKELQLTQQQP